MDIDTFNRAKAAYESQQWETAAVLFSACAMVGEPGCGEACHLRGNALMRLGRVQEAVGAYRQALADPSYPNKGALFTNLGKAQIQLGDYQAAVDSLSCALDDPNYTGAYKALLALGAAYSRMGDARSAGVAYRKAALEANNPDPAKALVNLGVCFVQLRRPADAAEAYRTALDFSQDADERNMIQSNLGQAYVASNRMAEAVQAFQAATSSGYQLLPPAQADYEKALLAVNSMGGQRSSGSFSDGMGSFATSGRFDPLDPLGRSGEVMPSPDQSGFFDITDEQIEAAGKNARRAKSDGSSHHTGLKILIAFLAIVVALAIAAVILYFRGFGIPGQADAINSVMRAGASASSTATGWSSSVPATERVRQMESITDGSSYRIDGMDAGTATSTALLTVILPEGGELHYDVVLVREGIGWTVQGLTPWQPSASDAGLATDAQATVAA